MREIKFRIYDLFLNQMVLPEANFGTYVIRLNGLVTDGSIGTKCILMQFTGIKDRNGKNIYEDDILDGHGDGVVKVVWRGTGWECDFEDGGNIGLDEMCEWFGNSSTVIGNLHENPELFQGTK